MLKKSRKSLLSSSIYSLVLVLFVVTASAAHSSNENSHARRSLDRKRQPGLVAFVDGNEAKRDDGSLLDQLGLGDLVGDVTSLVGPTSTSLASTTTSSDSSSSSTTDSTTESGSSSGSSSSSASSSSSTSSSSSSVTTTSSTSTTSSSSGGILDTLTSVVGGLSTVLNDPTSTTDTSASTTASDTSETNTSTDTSTTPTQADSTTPTQTDSTTPTQTDSTTPTQTDSTTSAPPETTPPPAESTTSTTSDGGILSTLFSGLSSVLDPPTSESTSSSTDGTPTSTSSSATITDPPSSSSATVTSSDSSDSGILSSIFSGLSSVLDPSSASSTITDFPPSSSSSVSESGSIPSSSGSVSDSVGPSGPSSSSGSIGPSDSMSISFPSGSVTVSSTSDSGSFISSSSTSQTSFSVESDLTFVLTQSQLAFTSVPTTTRSLSLSDPDEATTTISSSSASVAATFTSPPLPSDLPSKIYPQSGGIAEGVHPDGFTLVAMMFTSDLNWKFVAEDQYSSSQIFAFMPVIINTALGLTADRQSKTTLLQAYKPMSYRGPQDVNSLGTQFLTWIPSDEVANLAAMVQASKSPFYTAVSNPVAQQLAVRVDRGYSVVVQSDSGGGGPGSNPSQDNSGSSSDHTRQDAIIGVVSALGGIALLVLAFLGYRWYQRKKEQQHRRLSDPPGARPAGREFDQDSVGGQRRRSFYYAEDSLRGYQDAQQVGQVDAFGYNAYQSQAPGMTQRRNLVPGAISQPILRESSMNW